MVKYLAESENYKVISDHESAYLHFKNETSKKPVFLGDFMGDPDSAIISRDEKYLVVGGGGLIIYRLEIPSVEHNDAGKLIQRSEHFREYRKDWWLRGLCTTDLGEDKQAWYINGIYQDSMDYDWKHFRFVTYEEDKEAVYKMNAEDFSIEKTS